MLPRQIMIEHHHQTGQQDPETGDLDYAIQHNLVDNALSRLGQGVVAGNIVTLRAYVRVDSPREAYPAYVQVIRYDVDPTQPVEVSIPHAIERVLLYHLGDEWCCDAVQVCEEDAKEGLE